MVPAARVSNSMMRLRARNNPNIQSTYDNEKDDDLDAHWRHQYGSADSDSTMLAGRRCSSCAAELHCRDAGVPGFVPVEIGEEVDMRNDSTERVLCRRCYLLKHHNFLLNVNVSAVDYNHVIARLRDKPDALIVLVVDMLDIENSIYRPLVQLLGTSAASGDQATLKRPMIVVGNKIDLLPPDAKRGYMKQFKSVLRDALRQADILQAFDIRDILLTSARCGLGIEALVTKLFYEGQTGPNGRRDIYLLGCVNAGKSTLFNTLLQSDLCKIRAVDLIERACVSVWPGTTLHLLKFPAATVNSLRLARRQRRLEETVKFAGVDMVATDEWRHMQTLVDAANDNVASAQFEHLSKSTKQEVLVIDPKNVSNLYFHNNIVNDTTAVITSAERRHWLTSFDSGETAYVYDSPGTINEDSILQHLTLDELIRLVPRRVLQPRTTTLRMGQSLLVGGVARIEIPYEREVIDLNKNIFVTVFASERMPLHVVPTSEKWRFYSDNAGRAHVFGAPAGGAWRMSTFPKLVYRWVSLYPDERAGPRPRLVTAAAVADVTLSSVGWLSVTVEEEKAHERRTVLKVFTPNGVGVRVRRPLLPHLASVRGKRLPFSQFYAVKPMFIPPTDDD